GPRGRVWTRRSHALLTGGKALRGAVSPRDATGCPRDRAQRARARSRRGPSPALLDPAHQVVAEVGLHHALLAGLEPQGDAAEHEGQLRLARDRIGHPAAGAAAVLGVLGHQGLEVLAVLGALRELGDELRGLGAGAVAGARILL